jgi:hypothetical protein
MYSKQEYTNQPHVMRGANNGKEDDVLINKDRSREEEERYEYDRKQHILLRHNKETDKST